MNPARRLGSFPQPPSSPEPALLNPPPPPGLGSGGGGGVVQQTTGLTINLPPSSAISQPPPPPPGAGAPPRGHSAPPRSPYLRRGGLLPCAFLVNILMSFAPSQSLRRSGTSLASSVPLCLHSSHQLGPSQQPFPSPRTTLFPPSVSRYTIPRLKLTAQGKLATNHFSELKCAKMARLTFPTHSMYAGRFCDANTPSPPPKLSYGNEEAISAVANISWGEQFMPQVL